MILNHEIEAQFLGAVIAQAGSPAVAEVLSEFDPALLGGHVVREVIAYLGALVAQRGVGLSPAEARRHAAIAVGDNPEAVDWVMSLDPVAGGSADLEKLVGTITRNRVAIQANALLAETRVDPDRLDEDLAGILTAVSGMLSHISDDRWKVERLDAYLREYAAGRPVIPAERSHSILRFGWAEADDPTDGIVAPPGTLGVIAAPPTWGKSVAVSQLVTQTALDGRYILAASLEQSREQVAMRSIASLMDDWKTSVTKGFHRSRDVSQACFEAAERISILSPGSGTPWFRIEAQARRLHRAGRLDVLVVDYFTLLEPPSLGKQFNSAAAYGWISKAAKRLAQELGIVVVLVAQFNRQIQDFAQEPEMRDLKETGQLEQDADWMLFLWAVAKKEGLVPALDDDNRVSCWKKAKNRWGKVDFSGSPRYCEIDPARDRIHGFTRTTDAAGGGAPAHGGSHARL